ncbi:MAG: hypothetical protein ACRD07_08045 [Acidimicrobiales bacterium]
MTVTPPQPRDDDDLDWWLCPPAKVPDGDDQPGGAGESIPWASFALDGYELVPGDRTRRWFAQRILNLVDRPQRTH